MNNNKNDYDYERRKNEWASKYTTIVCKINEWYFGMYLDVITTRRLYKILTGYPYIV